MQKGVIAHPLLLVADGPLLLLGGLLGRGLLRLLHWSDPPSHRVICRHLPSAHEKIGEGDRSTPPLLPRALTSSSSLRPSSRRPSSWPAFWRSPLSVQAWTVSALV